jgi:indole-3-glycerol phosphate synthase
VNEGSILEKLVSAARLRLERDKALISETEMIKRASAIKLSGGEFSEKLKAPGLSFICEVKKASPSKGVISEDFPYLDIARDYEKGGAAAVSVLTEPDFFLGGDRYLEEIARAVNLPVLRKDFIIDPYQIYQAKALGAKAVLLICAVLEKERLKEFLALAEELGLSALAETRDREEIETALSANAKIIGVNNRNLKTFEVDPRRSVNLRKFVPRDVIFVAESGIRSAGDTALLAENGVDAVLIGETLMRSPDRIAALREMRSSFEVKNAMNFKPYI